MRSVHAFSMFENIGQESYFFDAMSNFKSLDDDNARGYQALHTS
jgi:hypothetical protein